MFKIHELIKCCEVYPRYHKADGVCWVQCPKCGNRSRSYLTAGLSANKGWNDLRTRQLEIQKLYGTNKKVYK
jgi:predicted  nucleic acid-binding Zn-ribbon protein